MFTPIMISSSCALVAWDSVVVVDDLDRGGWGSTNKVTLLLSFPVSLSYAGGGP